MIIVEVFGWKGQEEDLPAKLATIAHLFLQKKIPREGFEIYVIPSSGFNPVERRLVRISFDQGERNRIAAGQLIYPLTKLGFGIQTLIAQNYYPPLAQPKSPPPFV